MLRNGVCKYNSMINCEIPDKCKKCNWNPTYFEEKKRKAREERERMKEEMKNNGKKKSLL
jgi:DNA-directed RNA polymerase specialized sigma subunit